MASSFITMPDEDSYEVLAETNQGSNQGKEENDVRSDGNIASKISLVAEDNDQDCVNESNCILKDRAVDDKDSLAMTENKISADTTITREFMKGDEEEAGTDVGNIDISSPSETVNCSTNGCREGKHDNVVEEITNVIRNETQPKMTMASNSDDQSTKGAAKDDTKEIQEDILNSDSSGSSGNLAVSTALKDNYHENKDTTAVKSSILNGDTVKEERQAGRENKMARETTMDSAPEIVTTGSASDNEKGLDNNLKNSKTSGAAEVVEHDTIATLSLSKEDENVGEKAATPSAHTKVTPHGTTESDDEARKTISTREIIGDEETEKHLVNRAISASSETGKVERDDYTKREETPDVTTFKDNGPSRQASDELIENQEGDNSLVGGNSSMNEDTIVETKDDEISISSQTEPEDGHVEMATPSTPLGQTKGAKILMNRFSSWRKKANEAVSTNMGALSKSQQFQEFRMMASAALTRKKDEDEEQRTNSDDESSQSGGNQRDKNNGSVCGNEKGMEKIPGLDTDNQAEQNDASLLDRTSQVEEPSSGDDCDEPVTTNPRMALRTHSIVDDDDESASGSTTDYEDSDYQTSEYTESGFSADENRFRAAAASLYMRTAASVMVDSVATGFRGRYGEGADEQEQMKGEPAAKSQTEKILSSSAAKHMQEILDTLDATHEYVMLLGKGMLGVNLRQTYLKHHGVYIDYLVEGGAAYNSKVVFPGDIIQKVGSANVHKGTIFTVPKMIAEAKRPTVLVFSTGQDTTHSKVNYIDFSIAMMHQLHGQTNSAISNMPLQSGTSEEHQAQQEVESEQHDSGSEEWQLEHHGLDSVNPANVPAIPPCALESVEMHLAKRGSGLFSVEAISSLAAKTGMDNFRLSIHHAFVTCALDGRRLPFLSRFLSTFTSDEYEVLNTPDDQKTTASIELMFFLELTSFVELYGATPQSRRLDIGKRIAFKFLLPCKIGNRKENPMFDFSHLCSESALEDLRRKFTEESEQGLESIGRNIFLPYQEAVAEKLCGTPFISFLLSDECSRMRGYLRNTSPYRTVSPGDFFFHAVADESNTHAANHLLYNIVFLLCQREREICGENDDIVGEKTNRVQGAAGGMCCAVFLKKRLLRLIKAIDCDSGSSEEASPEIPVGFNDLKHAFVQAWDMFLSPEGGALQWTSTSNETDHYLEKARNCLKKAQQEKEPRSVAQILSNDEMQQTLESLAESLLYDYSVDSYTKFREHPFHEWMCSEIQLSSGRINDDFENRIPNLSPGSITRLLRKAQLPNGISAHKPSGLDFKSPSNISNSKGSERLEQQNAHHAIIFGTDDGSGIIDRNLNPSLSKFDLRRYTSQQLCESPNLCQVHPTVESYAFVPPRRKSPFSRSFDSKCVSADGWDISLIDFMIPGAQGDSSEVGGTYGVSLVFQQSEQSFMDMCNNRSSTIAAIKLDYQAPIAQVESSTRAKENEDGHLLPLGDNSLTQKSYNFSSPLSSFKASEAESTQSYTASALLQVDIETPSFNEKIKNQSWSERIFQQRASLSTGAPITIGIVLLSSQNVIPAMRATLLNLIRDFSRIANEKRDEESTERFICNPLIELLGNYSYLDVEAESIRSLLHPYMCMGSRPWLMSPLATSQLTQYRDDSTNRLLQSLPLIPLSLLYITILLEQKVVFSSSRRSLLLSASIAITDLLDPLKWEHLIVPLAPSYLARDLLQYPAPFIIGLASEDEGNLELLSSLPDDVSLVDLDVGRVILAPNIAFDCNVLESHALDRQDSIIQALRSQILYLAQTLGLAFSSQLGNNSLNTDSPVYAKSEEYGSKFSSREKLRSLCRSFLCELLAGSASCSYWIEEHDKDADKRMERTVLFDEDRFFQIKSLRANGKFSPLFLEGDRIGQFALNLDDFDLIIECFLRCQSFNSYLSTREKISMAFSLS